MPARFNRQAKSNVSGFDVSQSMRDVYVHNMQTDTHKPCGLDVLYEILGMMVYETRLCMMFMFMTCLCYFLPNSSQLVPRIVVFFRVSLPIR